MLALPTLLLAMDVTVLYLAVPRLAEDLEPTNNQLLWIVDIYGFMIAGFLVAMGTLGDRIGRRKLLMIGASAFGIASAAAAYAPSPELLIAARALLGVAGATLMPSTLALISNMFRDTRQRATAIGIWATCLSAGVAAGPVVGGLLLEWFWWGSVFLLGIPAMVLLLVTAPVLLPEYRDTKAGRLDLTSVALSLAAIMPIIYGIKQLAKDGPTAVPAAAIVVGAAFGMLFARRQRTLTDPLLDLRLFSHRAFTAALLILLLTFSMMGGIYLFVTQYLQVVEDLSPLIAGLWLVAPAFALIVSSMLTSTFARTIRPGYLVGAATAIAALGYLVLAMVSSDSGLSLLLVGFTLVYIGTGPVMVLGAQLVVGSAPPEKAGSAAAMSETSSEFGLALGVAILGAIGTAVYGADVADAVKLTPEARDAFTNGLNTVAIICATVAVALAFAAVRLLRHAPHSHNHPEQAHQEQECKL